MKKIRYIVSGIGIALVALATTRILSVHDLQRPRRIERETGLTLPEDARILRAKADVWSLADGANDEWLVEMPLSWEEWLKTNMTLEAPDGISWKHIRQFSEVAPIADPSSATQALDSVWRSTRRARNGGTETTYFYLAGDKKVGLLQTFRP